MDVRKARGLKGWTQEHLAGAAGLDVRTIRRAEAGDGISSESMMAIKAALGDPEVVVEAAPEPGVDHPAEPAPHVVRSRRPSFDATGAVCLAAALSMAAGLAFGFLAGRQVVDEPYQLVSGCGWDTAETQTWATLALAKSLRLTFANPDAEPFPGAFSSAARSAFFGSDFYKTMKAEVVERKAVVGGTPRSEPVVLWEGERGGRRVLRVQVPFAVTFTTAQETWTHNVNFEMLIEADDRRLLIDDLTVQA